MRRYFLLLTFIISIGKLSAQNNENNSDSIPNYSPVKVFLPDTAKTEKPRVFPDSIPPREKPKVVQADTIKQESLKEQNKV